MIDSGTLFTWAWRILPRLPSSLVRAAFDVVAVTIHALNGRGVQQLESNLSRVSPVRGKYLRRLSRDGMRRYMRYYAEAFQLPKFTPAQISARVRTVNADAAQKALSESTVVAGLGHLGNWDLAGAWSEQNFAHVVTVAEKLNPEELFQQFLYFRENLGMKIFAFVKGEGVFQTLVDTAVSEPSLMPLLADRDLSADGVEVDVCGHAMRVAPGPAAISKQAQVPFIGIFIRHERLTGSRRRLAGSPWGIVIEFTDPIQVPEGENTPARMMQQWADEFGNFLVRHPEDWHMLQKCFIADLDQERLAQADKGTYSDREGRQ